MSFEWTYGLTKIHTQIGTANFRFPALDPATEAFLWRRKADLEAAIEAMPATAAAAEAAAPQSAPGRAAADLQDSGTGVAGDPGASATETPKARPNEKRRGSTAEPVPRRDPRGSLRPRQPSGRAESEGRTDGRRGSRGRGRHASSRGGRLGGMENIGAVAATALLAAANSRGSAAANGARGLQLTMIKEAFARLDMDGDGFITPGDLGLAFRNMGRDASDRRWVDQVSAICGRACMRAQCSNVAGCFLGCLCLLLEKIASFDVKESLRVVNLRLVCIQQSREI